MRPPSRPRARGITFLEVIFASVTLAMVAAAMLSALNHVHAMQSRQELLLGCAEVANRLIIQYLDDAKQLPSQFSPIPYGADEYRWRMDVRPITATPNPRFARAVAAQSRRDGAVGMDRLRRVTVTVWVAESSGGAGHLADGVPSVTITRLVDPMAVWRNPDSLSRRVDTEEGIRELLNIIAGMGDTPVGGGPQGDGAQERRR